MSDQHSIPSRAPRGVTGAAMTLRLKPDERALLDQLAKEAERSVSSMARVLVLEALRSRGLLDINSTDAQRGT